MDQAWFEMNDIRRSNLASKAWIPLRSAQCIERAGKPWCVGFHEDRTKTVSLAVPIDNRSDVLALSWDEIGIGYDHRGCDVDGQYVPADVYKDDEKRFVGVHLVLNQPGVGSEPSQWHLHQDFVVTLGLKREDDTWVRPAEDHIEVARLHRSSDGSPALLEVRASHLQDYLCARCMGLVVNSFRSRSEIVDDATHISWAEDDVEEKGECARWVGRRMAIDESGRPYGGSAFVLHVRRTDVNPEDDIPVLRPPTDTNLQSRSWVKQFSGTKLYRISGEFWRKEWLEPAASSPIVRGDKLTTSVSFIIDAEGNRAKANELVDSGRWLWFRPTVVPALVDRRGGSLRWWSRDTGEVACSPDQGVNFGINAIGLVNAYAEHVALLPEWQQRIWAAHNANPEGNLSEELKAMQVDAMPVSTHAPETLLAQELDRLQTIAQAKLKVKLRRQHSCVSKLAPRIHRFRASDQAGLFALAKDLVRITAEDIDEKELHKIESPPKHEHWRSLKSLEKVLATQIDPADARAIVSPLVGVNKLRLSDAHLPSGDIDESMSRIGVDAASPLIVQGYELIQATVTALHRIGTVIDENW